MNQIQIADFWYASIIIILIMNHRAVQSERAYSVYSQDNQFQSRELNALTNFQREQYDINSFDQIQDYYNQSQGAKTLKMRIRQYLNSPKGKDIANSHLIGTQTYRPFHKETRTLPLLFSQQIPQPKNYQESQFTNKFLSQGQQINKIENKINKIENKLWSQGQQINKIENKINKIENKLWSQGQQINKVEHAIKRNQKKTDQLIIIVKKLYSKFQRRNQESSQRRNQQYQQVQRFHSRLQKGIIGQLLNQSNRFHQKICVAQNNLKNCFESNFTYRGMVYIIFESMKKQKIKNIYYTSIILEVFVTIIAEEDNLVKKISKQNLQDFISKTIKIVCQLIKENKKNSQKTYYRQYFAQFFGKQNSQKHRFYEKLYNITHQVPFQVLLNALFKQYSIEFNSKLIRSFNSHFFEMLIAAYTGDIRKISVNKNYFLLFIIIYSFRLQKKQFTRASVKNFQILEKKCEGYLSIMKPVVQTLLNIYEKIKKNFLNNQDKKYL